MIAAPSGSPPIQVISTCRRSNERFLRHVRPGGRILDAGCGVEPDALAFAERGYSVVAFDASAAMVRLAWKRIAGRAEVLQMRFEDGAWREEFDGIWASASLLHMLAAELPAIARRLAGALRPCAILYMSFSMVPASTSPNPAGSPTTAGYT